MPRGLITATALREDQAIELEGELPPPPQFNLRVFFLIFELMPANAGDIKELVKELVVYALVRCMLGRSRPSAGTREECGQPPQLCLTGLHSPYQPLSYFAISCFSGRDLAVRQIAVAYSFCREERMQHAQLCAKGISSKLCSRMLFFAPNGLWLLVQDEGR